MGMAKMLDLRHSLADRLEPVDPVDVLERDTNSR